MLSKNTHTAIEKLKLSEIADINANSVKKDFGYSKIQYVDISSVGTGTLEQKTDLKLSEAPSRAKRLVKNGSIIIATVRPNRRSFYYFRHPDDNIVVSTGFAVIDARENTDSRFLYYLLSSQNFTDYLVSRAKGAAYPAVDAEVFKNAELVLPSLEYQQKTSSILAAFDDLIENNTKRINLLEQTAQLIYKEWFVNFKFPGHEKVKMVKSKTEFGEIPMGWEIEEIGNVVKTLGGGTPSTGKSEFWENGKINWYSPVDLTANNSTFISDSRNKINELGLKKSSARMFPAYSVMMTSRATIGVVAINTTDACTNQGFITCIPSDKLRLYHLYFWLKSNLDEIDNLASGATFKEITKTNFRKMKVLIAVAEIESKFFSSVEPIFKEVEILQSQNDRLCTIKNLLLPKLMSGEIEVCSVNKE